MSAPHDDVLRNQCNHHRLNLLNPNLATDRLRILSRCVDGENPTGITFRRCDLVENRLSQTAQLFNFLKLNARRSVLAITGRKRSGSPSCCMSWRSTLSISSGRLPSVLNASIAASREGSFSFFTVIASRSSRNSTASAVLAGFCGWRCARALPGWPACRSIGQRK